MEIIRRMEDTQSKKSELLTEKTVTDKAGKNIKEIVTPDKLEMSNG